MVDTATTVIVFETSLAPVLYVNGSDVRMDPLEPSRTGMSTYCNYKGTPTYWSAHIGDAVAEDVDWSYEDPFQRACRSRACSRSTATRPRYSPRYPTHPTTSTTACDAGNRDQLVGVEDKTLSVDQLMKFELDGNTGWGIVELLMGGVSYPRYPNWKPMDMSDLKQG